MNMCGKGGAAFFRKTAGTSGFHEPCTSTQCVSHLVRTSVKNVGLDLVRALHGAVNFLQHDRLHLRLVLGAPAAPTLRRGRRGSFTKPGIVLMCGPLRVASSYVCSGVRQARHGCARLTLFLLGRFDRNPPSAESQTRGRWKNSSERTVHRRWQTTGTPHGTMNCAKGKRSYFDMFAQNFFRGRGQDEVRKQKRSKRTSRGTCQETSSQKQSTKFWDVENVISERLDN